MKNRSLYLLALGAFLSTAYAADNELVLPNSIEGLTWENATWSAGAVPTSEQTVIVNIGDNNNPLTISNEVSVARIDVQGNSYLLLSGENAVFATTATTSPYGDIFLSGNSKLEVKDGASVSVASGMSFQVNNGASLLVDASTITGKFNNYAYGVTIQNNSTWNATGYNAVNANILVKDSTIFQQGDFKMGVGQQAGQTKYLKTENVTWDANGKGINLTGIVDLYDTTISNSANTSTNRIDHFNVGAESGNTRYENVITLQGSSADSLTTVKANNYWLNTAKDATTTFLQNGNTSVQGGAIQSSNSTKGGGDFTWLIQNDNNSVSLSSDASWGDNNRTENESGTWLLTTANTNGGSETFATNTSWTMNSIDLRSSAKVDNTFQSLVDWAGATNNMQANYDIRIHNSAAASSDGLAKFTVRDNATVTTNRYLVIGDQNAKSGTALFEVKDGGSYTMKSALNIVNSTLEGSTATSELLIEGTGVLNRTGGNLNIGVGSSNTDTNPRQDAISGTSIATFKDLGEITFGGGILLAGSSVDLSESDSTHTNVAKLVIENTKLTMNGELYFAHSQSNGGTIYGGTSIIEITGENSGLISANKGLYSGYNTTTYGGDRKILVSGKNNILSFGSDGAFYMNSANGAKQLGGSFEVNITGEGHTFSTKSNLDIGRNNAAGGTNTFYVEGTSASNKNQVIIGAGNIYIKASSDDSSTIVNTFELAGNTVLKRNEGGDTVNLYVSSYDAASAGQANVFITGENNELYLNNFSVGRSDLETAKVLVKIEGSTHTINVENFAMRTSGIDTTAATLQFVSDTVGISQISTTTINEISGFIDIDFSQYIATSQDATEFVLISAQSSWNGSNYETDSDTDYIRVALANENDTWRTFMDGNNLVLEYTSSVVVPEPSTYAAIFGAIALALASYRRRK